MKTPSPFLSSVKRKLFSALRRAGKVSGVSLIWTLKFLADAFELRYDLFPIPPNQVAAFEVVVNFFFTVDDGGVGVNFSDHAGNAISPVLQLELLTAPFASVAEASFDQ